MTPETQTLFGAGIGALIVTAGVVGVWANIRLLKLQRKLAQPTMQKEEKSAATEWIVCYDNYFNGRVRTNGVSWQTKCAETHRIGGTLAEHVEDLKVILREHPDAEFYNRDPMYFEVSWWEGATVDHPLVKKHLEEEEAQKQQEENAIEFLRRTRPEVLK